MIFHNWVIYLGDFKKEPLKYISLLILMKQSFFANFKKMSSKKRGYGKICIRFFLFLFFLYTESFFVFLLPLYFIKKHSKFHFYNSSGQNSDNSNSNESKNNNFDLYFKMLNCFSKKYNSYYYLKKINVHFFCKIYEWKQKLLIKILCIILSFFNKVNLNFPIKL